MAKSLSSRQTTLAAISWEGDSHDVLLSWSKDVRIDFGMSLREMQEGRPARLPVRPMQSIGKGVFELKTQDDRTWYRMIYLARIDDVIYVLDCFEKDTAKTERKNIARATARLAAVRQRIADRKKAP